MRRCWSEGELRAYLDCELPRDEMEAVTEHVGECTACSAALEEIRRRASFVDELFQALPTPDLAGVVAPEVLLRRKTPGWRPLAWTAGALAAAAAAAILFVGKPAGQPSVPAPMPPPAITASAPEPAGASQTTERKTAAARPRPKRAARAVPAPRPETAGDTNDVRYYLALDNEPFEMGEVVRVALGPTNVPADVVFSPDGRPRAIRLISFSTQGGQ